MKSLLWRNCIAPLAAFLLMLSCTSAAASHSIEIQKLSDRVSELSVQIRAANSIRDREKAAELREEREKAQQELRNLRRLEREQKAAAEQQAKREATERAWVTYPPEKQLCAAIEYHRLDLVQKVFERNEIELNQVNDHCFFPLADAAARGHLDIAEYLLQKKSPLAMRSPHFHRLISATDAAAASRQDRRDMLALLKKYGATLHDSREDATGGFVTGLDDSTRKLLKEKYKVTTNQLSFGSPLLRALEQGHINNVRWLLREGADPNESVEGRTALMAAVDSNDLDKVSILILAGADVNQQSENRPSVLAQAEKRRETVSGRRKAEMDEIILYLRNRGATRPEQES